MHKTIKPWNFRPCIQTDDDDMKCHSHPKQSQTPQEMRPSSLSKEHVRFSHGSDFLKCQHHTCKSMTYKSTKCSNIWGRNFPQQLTANFCQMVHTHSPLLWNPTINNREIFALLGCYTALIGIYYLCFGTTYRSIVKGQLWPLTMGRETEITNK